MSSARSSVLATGGSLAQGVRIPDGQARETAEVVVGVEQLLRVADVAPVPRGRVAVDRHARNEPRDEAAWLVARVVVVEVCPQERRVRAVIDVRGGRDERRGRALRLLRERDETAVRVEVDVRVLLN